MFALYAVTFYVGALLVRYDDLNPRDMFVAIFAIMYCSMGAGMNNQLMGDIGAARNSAKNIIKILDSEDEY
jgi:ATP-binding cassette subfamily B (MDR/TAP) protein 1